MMTAQRRTGADVVAWLAQEMSKPKPLLKMELSQLLRFENRSNVPTEAMIRLQLVSISEGVAEIETATEIETASANTHAHSMAIVALQ